MKVVTKSHSKQWKLSKIGNDVSYIASDVTCTDIDKDTLKNVDENVKSYRIEDRVAIKYSDALDDFKSFERHSQLSS